MSRRPEATMTSCSEEGHIGRQRRPAIMEGEAVMPAPAAVKGSAYGPLRALDRGSRRHHFCPYGRRADVIAMYAVRRSWQVTLRRGMIHPHTIAGTAGTWRERACKNT